MRIKLPTRAQVEKLWVSVCKKQKIKIVYSRAWYRWFERRVAKRCLKAMGVSRVDNFLATRYISLQVGNRKTIMCPVRIGARGTGPVDQLGVLAHELTHFDQLEDAGGWDHFYIEYYCRPGVRAVYEGIAKGGNADIQAHFGLTVSSPTNVFDARFAKMYKLNPTQLHEAKEAYRRRLNQLLKNRVSTPGGEIVIKALKGVM